MQRPKILLWDLETGGVQALRASLGMVLCFGYKWYGEKEVYCKTVNQFPGWFNPARPFPIDDTPLIKFGLKIMEEADLLVAHYGDKFDRRFFQGRCAMNNLPPPPPTKQRDTWRVARTAFNFHSNRLGDLAIHLGLKEKKHQKTRDEWPGWWLQAMAGNASKIGAMAKYCAQDVRTLEGIYRRIRVYDNPHPRMYINRNYCRLCGGAVQYRGVAYVGENVYRRYRCTRCQKWDRERTKIKDD